MQHALFLQVDGGVHAVDIALIQLPAQQFDGFAEPLEVDDLPFPEELDYIVDIGIIAQPQDVVIGHPGLLFWHAAKLTTSKNTNFEDKRPIPAILLLIFLHFANSGLKGQAFIVVKIYEKTRVTIAWGEMVRCMAQNQITDPEQFKSFDRLSFRFDTNRSDDRTFVFLR